MREWRLSPTVRTPTLGANVQSVHKTGAGMIESVVRAALAHAGRDTRALDLAYDRRPIGQQAPAPELT